MATVPFQVQTFLDLLTELPQLRRKATQEAFYFCQSILCFNIFPQITFLCTKSYPELTPNTKKPSLKGYV